MKIRIIIVIILIISVLASWSLGCANEKECKDLFAAEPNSENFAHLKNPTAQDLNRLTSPTIDDFHRLSATEQQAFIESSNFGPAHLEIASTFFSAQPNVNINKEHFSRFAKVQGVAIQLEGEVISYSKEGMLKGLSVEGEPWEVNVLEFADLFYSLRVDDNNQLLIEIEQEGKIHSLGVGGNIGYDEELIISEGSIGGRRVVDARIFEFYQDGEGIIEIALSAKEFNGLSLSRQEKIDVVLEESKTIIKSLSEDLEIVSLEQGQEVYLKGFFKIDTKNFHRIKGKIKVRDVVDLGRYRVIDNNLHQDSEISLYFQKASATKTISWKSKQKDNKVIFTPTDLFLEGENFQVYIDKSSFLLEPMKARALLTFIEKPPFIKATTQGAFRYESGPQEFYFQNGKNARFFTRSVSADSLIPVDLITLDEDGNPTGNIFRSGYSSVTSEGRDVLTSMDSNAEMVRIIQLIASGDYEEINKLNERIEEITYRWDKGVEPNEDDRMFIEGMYKALLTGSRVIHGSASARALHHYLGTSGKPLDYDPDIFLRRPEIRYVMQEMERDILTSMTEDGTRFFSSRSVPDRVGEESEVQDMENLEHKSFGTVKNGIIWTPDKELRYSFGKFGLKANARKVGERVEITWEVEDLYDYERKSEKSISIPAGILSERLKDAKEKIFGEDEERDFKPDPIYVPDRLAAYLTDIGMAREFAMRSSWKTTCTIEGCKTES